MTQIGANAEARFWFKWVIGNALASALGLFIASQVAMVFYVLGFMISGLGHSTAIQTVFSLVFLGIMFAVYGFFLGLGQWIILNLRVPTTRYWFWLSSLGWGIIGCRSSVGIYPDLSAIAAAILFGGSSGFIVGFTQWLVLRRMVTSAGWWPGISAIGYTIGYALPAWINLHEIVVGDELFLAIELGQIIAIAITGLGLLWMVKPLKSSPSLAA